MEDFVTFDLSKKLKEKGYPQVEKNTLAMYDEDGCISYLCPTLDINRDYYIFDDFDEDDCVSPTISQVLKWLREEKKLHIELWVSGKRPIKWHHTIHTLNHQGERKGWSSGAICNDYEQAALAGIEYVLDNLI